MPALADILVAVLLVSSGVLVLVAALGLWRLPDFFLRMHAPALASTLGAWIVTLASIVHFSTRGAGLFPPISRRLPSWKSSLAGPVT